MTSAGSFGRRVLDWQVLCSVNIGGVVMLQIMARNFVFLFLLATASAQADETLTYLKAGQLIDVLAGEVRSSQVIVIQGDKIVRVANAADVAIPADALLIDLSQHTVLPGLIDTHDHLTGDHRFHGYRGLGISLPRETLYGVLNARKTLHAGFTTVRNVGASGYSDVALRDAINDGEIDGPRLRVSGPALGITGGHCDNNLLPPGYRDKGEAVADGPWAVRAKVREVIKYGADLIKFCATGGVLSKGDSVGGQQYTLEEMQALVDEAHQHKRKVAAHAHGAVYPHGDNGKQFGYMVEYGMTPMQAIQAATVHAAELIGWPDTVGAIGGPVCGRAGLRTSSP